MWDIKPIGSAGATFAAAACMSAGIREKDDYINASIGGALAGSLFGVACKWLFMILYIPSSTGTVNLISLFVTKLLYRASQTVK